MVDPVRVKFPLINDPAGYDAEWMWAEPLRDSTFRLDSSPFSAYGLSADDIFQVKIIGGILVFDRVVKKSGNRTLRVRLPRGKRHEDFLTFWQPLEDLGCSFEGSQIIRPFYSITVPPGASLDAAVSYLEAKEVQGVWQFEEADVY